MHMLKDINGRRFIIYNTYNIKYIKEKENLDDEKEVVRRKYDRYHHHIFPHTR
jgi:hypothetical protein